MMVAVAVSMDGSLPCEDLPGMAGTDGMHGGQTGSRAVCGSEHGGVLSMEKQAVVVAYLPHVLRNMGEICRVFGVGEKTVRAWAEKGAPIAVEGEWRRTRYSAELGRLQDWRLNKSQCRFTEYAFRQAQPQGAE